MALTRSIAVLLIARILQGLSGAVVYTVGYAILFDVIGSEKIGQAMGFVSMCQSFGLLIGPAIGGILYEWGGYFKTFIPAFVIIAVEIALRGLVIVRKERGAKPSKLSHGEEGEAAKAPLLGPEGSNNKPLYGTDLENPTTASTTSLPPANPSPPLSSTFCLILSHPRILIALLALFLLNTLLTAYDATLPIHISTTFTYPASYSSFLFLAMVAPFLLSPIAGYVVDHPRYGGTKYPALIGWVVLTPPVCVLKTVGEGAPHPFLTMALCLFAIGLGSAIALPALMAEVSLVVESIEDRTPGVFGERGVLSLSFGIMNTAFAGGFFSGPVLAGWLMGAGGWNKLGTVLAVGAAVCTVGVGVGTGGWIWGKR